MALLVKHCAAVVLCGGVSGLLDAGMPGAPQSTCTALLRLPKRRHWWDIVGLGSLCAHGARLVATFLGAPCMLHACGCRACLLLPRRAVQPSLMDITHRACKFAMRHIELWIAAPLRTCGTLTHCWAVCKRSLQPHAKVCTVTCESHKLCNCMKLPAANWLCRVSWMPGGRP
ncbi:hypothetical protein COO60DRAFT_1505477, partial [Scenedesmus sp. NREL 46B-D3]